MHSLQREMPDKYMREEQLAEQFADMVQAFTVSPEQYKWMVDGLKEINGVKDNELAERRQFLNAEISRLNNRLSQLYEDKLDGVIDSSFYSRKAKEGQERLADVQEQLERLQSASETHMALGLQILEFAKDAHPLFNLVENTEKAKLLKIVFSKCTLKDGKLSPTYKKPFDVLVEGHQDKHNYPQGNSNPRRLREREVS
jgi:site-specific DNA recombinase